MKFVIWSGGCDSTHVLNTLSKDASINNPVVAISVNHNGVDNDKNRLEKVAREKIKKRLAGRPIEYVEVDVNITGYDIPPGKDMYGLSQPCIWLGNIIPYMPYNSEIYFGYIEGDDFFSARDFDLWSTHENFERIVRSMLKINLKDNVVLIYPLAKTSKKQIIEDLKIEGLYELCWWCESPRQEGTVCECCHPCKTHRKAIGIEDECDEKDNTIGRAPHELIDQLGPSL